MSHLITLLQLCKQLHMMLDNTGSAKHCSWDYLHSSSIGICRGAIGQKPPFSTLFKWISLAIQDRLCIAFHLHKRVWLVPFMWLKSKKVSPEVFWAEFWFQETKELFSSYWVLQHLIHGETPSFHTLLTRFFAVWREKGKTDGMRIATCCPSSCRCFCWAARGGRLSDKDMVGFLSKFYRNTS